ncbi:Mitochondrial import inner membrane translocase subunit tim22 [Tilletia horrida]|uniref:Mitochondrial import inner membrane translocase subunit TIM22 n=1 Tax=Tilletia horrida TaxID=155126 RepID=A0AAN6GHT5_9BASI|nr:Mitochondrial import inner membrane translocase subunit tim22 [Tilletia horrida]KAK0538476.1 Mitochondrial import inner membrane translocase subunit tim22 [Tilletia horrida]KAK0541512.1 Mitochondrial import inner membrane translocase subunit tim22 [Tilletia horrida]KAK0562610.1 Mitochondrial import inner membrane translocase subunit tim22 [Tilletia horrida]
MPIPMVAPIYMPGQEPLPAGFTEADRAQMAQMEQYSKYMAQAMESCPVKCAMAGVMGFGLGGFFSLLGSSFAMDDPLRRSNLQAAAIRNAAAGTTVPPVAELTTAQQTKEFFLETGRGMYRTGKGFGKVGALYSGIECCIEGYRAKHDIVNPVAAGFFTGAILARNQGPQAVLLGGAGFAAFSAAIDYFFFHRQPSDDD